MVLAAFSASSTWASAHSSESARACLANRTRSRAVPASHASYTSSWARRSAPSSPSPGRSIGNPPVSSFMILSVGRRPGANTEGSGTGAGGFCRAGDAFFLLLRRRFLLTGMALSHHAADHVELFRDLRVDLVGAHQLGGLVVAGVICRRNQSVSSASPTRPAATSSIVPIASCGSKSRLRPLSARNNRAVTHAVRLLPSRNA